MSNPVTHNRPASRYGEDSRAPRARGVSGKLIVIGVIILLLIAGVFGFRYLQQREEDPVSISLVTNERVDDRTMRVWVDITRTDTEVDSYCIVTALNYAMAEVGRREVLLPAGGDDVQRLAVDVPTRDYPVAGSVYGCSTDNPTYMDFDNPVYTF